MAHDDQFTATGPAFNGSGFYRAGFSTNRAGADFTQGVNVEGMDCGVFGKCVKQAGVSRYPLNLGVGVYGKGDNSGVFGECTLGTSGVMGIHHNKKRPAQDGVGVIGAVTRGGTGVMGVSVTVGSLDALVRLEEFPEFAGGAGGDGVGVLGASGSSTGVMGMSQRGIGGEFTSRFGKGLTGSSNSGQGVVGTSHSNAAVTGTSDLGDGVIGNANGEVGAGVTGNANGGAGVEGKSASGVGLHGISKKSRGAVLESGENIAQMRLVPKKQKSAFVKLPKKGKVGDLILIQYPGGITADRKVTEICGLWLCVPASKRARGWASDDSNLWQEVLLGQVLTGTP